MQQSESDLSKKESTELEELQSELDSDEEVYHCTSGDYCDYNDTGETALVDGPDEMCPGCEELHYGLDKEDQEGGEDDIVNLCES